MAEASDPRSVALLVTRNFPPLLGGMENVNQHLLQELAREWRVALCGPLGCRTHAQGAFLVRESRVKPLWRFLLGSAVSASLTAWHTRPRIVLAGSGLSAPAAWAAARLSGATLVVYLHGLDIIAPSWIYQKCWLPFVRACDLVLVNSANTGRLASGCGVPAGRIHVLHPGTAVPELDQAAGEDFRKAHDLGDRPVLLSVGRLTRRKGLAEFVAESLPTILASHPDALLLVIGEDAGDALTSRGESERARIASTAAAAGVESSIKVIGHCSQRDLSAAYQAANVHVFPVLEQAGDVEGFGMVALEAAAHGLRTVAFSVGGVPDAVDCERSGALVPSGDYAALSSAVERMLATPQSDAAVAAGREFARDKDWAHFGSRLRSLLKGTNVQH